MENGYDVSDFPIICGSCLGDNPYIRMIKCGYDKECKVCSRPFLSYRWKAGVDGRFKKTEICLTCAKLKNVCQTCLLDLEFGLPVQLRDAALPEGLKVDIPESEGNRNYFNQIADKKVEEGMLPYGKTTYTSNIINVLARKTENYMKNRSHVCSFWMKGSCNRGEKCPYRHELPDDDESSSKQNIKDRFYGKNDPVAQRLLARLKEREKEKEKKKNKKENESNDEEDEESEDEIKHKSEKSRKRDVQNEEENNDIKEETPKRKKIDYNQPSMYPSMNPQRMGSAPRANKQH